MSLSISDATAVTIDPAIGIVPLTGTRTVSPTTTTTYTFTLTVSNEAGSVTDTVTVIVEPVTETIFDFVAQASHISTLWISGAGTLAFGCDPGEMEMGEACYLTNYVLEDNRTHDKVLFTYLQWVDEGFIQGHYIGVYNVSYRVEAGDCFYAEVGLDKGAYEGNVKFRVMIHLEGGTNKWIGEINDTYDGNLRTIDIELSLYAGEKADFILQVDANGSASQDWATWVEAKIIR